MFYLQKIIGFVLSPHAMICILNTIALVLLWRNYRDSKVSFWKNFQKTPWGYRLFVLSFFLFLSLSFWPVAYNLCGILERNYPAYVGDKPDKKSFVIVLGGGIHNLGREQGFLAQLSEDSLRRCLLAIEWARNSPHITLIFSGGRVYRDDIPSEANVMKKLALQMGIEESRIIEEDRSRSTWENALRVKDILNDSSFAVTPECPIYLFTSRIHLFRSHQVFQKLGVSVIPIPTHPTIELNVFWEKPFLFYFTLGNFRLSCKALHEILGCCFYKVMGRI